MSMMKKLLAFISFATTDPTEHSIESLQPPLSIRVVSGSDIGQ